MFRGSYLSAVLHDPVFMGLAGEPSYRGFCENPTADLLQDLPIGSTGAGLRMSPLVVAGRVSKMYAFRLMHSANSPAGRDQSHTRQQHPTACLSNFRQVILDLSTALLTASRNRYTDVSSQAVNVFSNTLAEVSSFRTMNRNHHKKCLYHDICMHL